MTSSADFPSSNAKSSSFAHSSATTTQVQPSCSDSRSELWLRDYIGARGDRRTPRRTGQGGAGVKTNTMSCQEALGILAGETDDRDVRISARLHASNCRRCRDAYVGPSDGASRIAVDRPPAEAPAALRLSLAILAATQVILALPWLFGHSFVPDRARHSRAPHSRWRPRCRHRGPRARHRLASSLREQHAGHRAPCLCHTVGRRDHRPRGAQSDRILPSLPPANRRHHDRHVLRPPQRYPPCDAPDPTDALGTPLTLTPRLSPSDDATVRQRTSPPWRPPQQEP